jgi:hypothetical protein
MAVTGARNTIRREILNEIIRQAYDGVFQISQTQGVDPKISKSIRVFEERFKEESRADRIERVASEVASASLFVPDPAGGQNNLRFPHKQFYEYCIAKAGWLILYRPRSATAFLLTGNLSKSTCCAVMISEPASIKYLCEIVGDDFDPFRQYFVKIAVFIGKVPGDLYRLLPGIVQTMMRRLSSNSTHKGVGIDAFTDVNNFVNEEILSSKSEITLVSAILPWVLAAGVVVGIFTGAITVMSDAFKFMSISNSLIIGATLPIVFAALSSFLGIIGNPKRNFVTLFMIMIIYRLEKTLNRSEFTSSATSEVNTLIWKECLAALRRNRYPIRRIPGGVGGSAEIGGEESELQELIRPMG